MSRRVQRVNAAQQQPQHAARAPAPVAPAAPAAVPVIASAVATTSSPLHSNARLGSLLQTVQSKPQNAEAWAEIAAIMDSPSAPARDPTLLREAYTRLVYMSHLPAMDAAKRFARTTHDVPLGVALLNAGHTSVLPWLTRGLSVELGDGAEHQQVLLDALRKHALVNHDAELMCDLVRTASSAVHALYVMLEDFHEVAQRADVHARRWPVLRDAVEGLLHEWIAEDNAEMPQLLNAFSAVAPKDYVPPEVAGEIVDRAVFDDLERARKIAAAFAPQLLAIAADSVSGPVGAAAQVAAALLTADTAEDALDVVKAHLNTAYAAMRKSNSDMATKVKAVADKLHVKLSSGGMFACFKADASPAGAPAKPQDAPVGSTTVPAENADAGAGAAAGK